MQIIFLKSFCHIIKSLLNDYSIHAGKFSDICYLYGLHCVICQTVVPIFSSIDLVITDNNDIIFSWAIIPLTERCLPLGVYFSSQDSCEFSERAFLGNFGFLPNVLFDMPVTQLDVYYIGLSYHE